MASVRDNTTLSRFELDAEGEKALAYYRLADGAMAFTHTETPARLRGRGFASRLVHGALEAARDRGLKVVPRCSFVASYVARHPEFNDIVA